MRKMHLLLGLSTIGLFAFVGCGDDGDGDSPGGSGAGGSSAGNTAKGGSGGSTSGGSSTGGKGGKGGSSSGGTTGQAGDGTGGSGDGCGNGPACGANAQCIDGECKLDDGQPCTENSECVNTCIAQECAPRSDLTEPCDYEGGGGAGGEGGGAPGAAGSPGSAGAGGAGPEMGNGDDADCLDGLGCDSGECKRKIGTDCTGPDQCLSGLCHKNKCTSTDAGTCVATMCMPPDMNGLCLPTTVMENSCSFNYLPNASCLYDYKGATACVGVCVCNLAP